MVADPLGARREAVWKQIRSNPEGETLILRNPLSLTRHIRAGDVSAHPNSQLKASHQRQLEGLKPYLASLISGSRTALLPFTSCDVLLR